MAGKERVSKFFTSKEDKTMALELVVAKGLDYAFEIVSVSPEKTMKHHTVLEPEGMVGFLYDTRNELTNYT